MRRKVIQIANSTQLVSLPRKWTQKYGIKKGDEMEVEEHGNKIVVSTEKGTQIKELNIDASKLTPFLTDRLVARSYQKAYDKVKIMFENEEQLKAIQNKLRELLGFEIMEQSRNNVEIRVLSSKLDVDFDTSLRKAFLVLMDMSNLCLEDFGKNDKKALQGILHRDEDINKFCYFCLRYLNKQQHDSSYPGTLYYLIESLEDLGDEYKWLSKNLANINSKKEDYMKLLSKLNEATKLIHEFFYKPDINKALKGMILISEIEKNVLIMMKTNNPNEIKALLNSYNLVNLLYKFITMRLDTLQEVKQIK